MSNSAKWLRANRMSKQQASGMGSAISARGGWVGNWPRWVPYAAVAWSLVYAVLGVYWAMGGSGFPYTPQPGSDIIGPLAGRFGMGVAWTLVIAAGLPAAVVGMAMLRGVSVLRPLFIAMGGLLAGILLLGMLDVTLLEMLGYTPYGIYALLTASEFGPAYLRGLIQWTIVHQVLCLLGGFVWLLATVSYARRSGDACLYCGRRDGPEGWTSPERAARWCRIAVYAAVVVPVLYALNRYAFALGIPFGISPEYLRLGQERGMWTMGAFMASFGLAGAVLTLGLMQRWGEVFPRWMMGLAGRRVPIALAVVPASIISVLLVVGGIAMWSGLAQLVALAVTGGTESINILAEAPTMLFPIWGVALAVATLGYYYRRRGPCGACGRGGSDEPVSGTSGFSIKRHPLLSYLALTFSITWGGILLVVGPGAVPLDQEHIVTLITLGYPSVLAGPTLSAILLTGLVYGKAGFRDLLSRLLRWRVGAGWYAVALLTAPLTMLAVLLALSVTSPAFRPLLFVTDDPLGLVGFSVVVGLWVGFFEELGWTGFVVPALLGRRWGVLRTGLVVGFVYEVWNLLIVYLAEVSDPTPGTLPLAVFLVATLFTWQVAYRVLIVWVYAHTNGSLLVAMLMSASFVVAWNTLRNPLTLTQTTIAVFYLVLAVVWLAIVAAFAVKDGRSLAGRGRPIRSLGY